jgi:hypothetical protein
LELARRNSASAAVFTARSPTIFEELKIIIGRRGGKPIVQGNAVGGAHSRVPIETSCEANCSKPESRSMPCRALRIRLGWFGSTTVLFLAAAIVLMVGLSAAPNLHERLHPTAGSLHECAVTLIAFGSCHHGAAAPLLIAPTTTLLLSKVAVLCLPWVESRFLVARVFEHAPPGNS